MRKTEPVPTLAQLWAQTFAKATFILTPRKADFDLQRRVKLNQYQPSRKYGRKPETPNTKWPAGIFGNFRLFMSPLWLPNSRSWVLISDLKHQISLTTAVALLKLRVRSSMNLAS